MKMLPVRRANDLFDRFSTLSSLFGGAFYPEVEEESGKYSWVPLVDITETLNNFEVSVELPGVNKDDVQINLIDNVLRISGERINPVLDKDTQHHRNERYYGKFQRIFRMTELVKEDAIKADLKDGLLTINIPKAERVKPKEIPIKVS